MYFPFNMNVIVTGECNRRCEHCCIHVIREQNSGHMMTMDHVEKLIRATLDSHYRFKTLLVTGGEPVLWPLLTDASKLLRESNLADKMMLFSNGDIVPAFTPKLMDLYDIVALSVYPDSDHRILSQKYPGKIQYCMALEHFPLPTEAVPGCLPAQCNCFGPVVYNGLVSECFAYLVAMRLGKTHTGREISVGYMDGFDPQRIIRNELCQWCLTNQKAIIGLPLCQPVNLRKRSISKS